MTDYSKELKIYGPTSRASPAIHPVVNSQGLIFIPVCIMYRQTVPVDAT